MRLPKLYIFIALSAVCIIAACNQKSQQEHVKIQSSAFKGLYSFQDRFRVFQECNRKTLFLVEDSSAQLELKYTNLVGFEKAGQTVYIEVKGRKSKSIVDGYDSTLVVTKVTMITKELPVDCN